MKADPQNFVAAATGLVFEARIAEQSPQVRACAGGGDAVRLQQLLARETSRSGALGIVSFGLAGALDPSLTAGELVVATEVVMAKARVRTHLAWTQHIADRCGAVARAAVLGSDTAVTASARKAQLFSQTGCALVDMESHVAGRVALDHDLPFVIVRAVVDPAELGVPAAALAGMKRDGTTDVSAVLAALAHEPRQIVDLLRLALAARKARARLLSCVRCLGPGFGLIDLG